MMHSDEKRKVVHASVCAPAAEALRAFCISHGVTVTAFLDGLSHVLSQYEDTPLTELDDVAPNVAGALRHARAIDAARRSREPRQFKQGEGNGGGPAGSTTVSSSSSDTAHQAPGTNHNA